MTLTIMPVILSAHRGNSTLIFYSLSKITSTGIIGQQLTCNSITSGMSHHYYTVPLKLHRLYRVRFNTISRYHVGVFPKSGLVVDSNRVNKNVVNARRKSQSGLAEADFSN